MGSRTWPMSFGCSWQVWDLRPDVLTPTPKSVTSTPWHSGQEWKRLTLLCHNRQEMGIHRRVSGSQKQWEQRGPGGRPSLQQQGEAGTGLATISSVPGDLGFEF